MAFQLKLLPKLDYRVPSLMSITEAEDCCAWLWLTAVAHKSCLQLKAEEGKAAKLCVAGTR